MKSRILSKQGSLVILFLCLAIVGYVLPYIIPPSDEETLGKVVEATGIVVPDTYQELAVHWYRDVDVGTVVYVKFPASLDIDKYALENGFHKVNRFFDHPHYTYGKEIPSIEELPEEHQRTVPKEGAIYLIRKRGVQCSSYRGVISAKARAMWLYVAW